MKFIVIDANYIKTPNGSEPYYRLNYDKTTDTYPYVPKEEIELLKNEIEDDRFYYVIFSHQSLSSYFMKRGISNREEIRVILEKRNSNEKKVLLCMNDYDHGDNGKNINGIHYYTLNFMPYIWHGIKETFNYSNEIHGRYPYLKDRILYDDPLHVIVTIDENMNIQIDWMEGYYQNVTPKDIGMGDILNGVSIEPKTSSLYINMQS